jgi:hypothetical protein
MMQENIPVKLASIPCSIIISITKERGTHFSIVMVPQNGINEGLDTLTNGEREEKKSLLNKTIQTRSATS